MSHYSVKKQITSIGSKRIVLPVAPNGSNTSLLSNCWW